MKDSLSTSLLDGAVVKFTDSIDGLLLYQRGDRWQLQSRRSTFKSMIQDLTGRRGSWELMDCHQNSEKEYNFTRNPGFSTALEALADVLQFLIRYHNYS